MCDVDNEKPFVCSAMGCGMRFTNEDHLNVHMKKHEMSLALNPGGHSSSPGLHILDQTPTPTKFLKNCEEMGLFQELSKNPFEEAFKKASDAEGVPLPGPQSNELNTPVPPSLVDKPANFLLHDVDKATVQSPTSSTPGLLKQQSLPLPTNTFALDLSGQRSREKVSVQASSTTREGEAVSVISIADSTQSPSKTTPSALPPLPTLPTLPSSATQEVITTQAVSSSLPGTKPSGNPVLLAPASTTAAQGTLAPQELTTMATAQPPNSASPSQGQQSCTMQVFLQLPSGQTVPVQIPATISTVLPGSGGEAASPQPQPQPAMAALPTTAAATPRAAPPQTAPSPSPATNTSTLALKQRLKQTLQAQQQQQQQQQQLQQQQQQQQGVVSSSSIKMESGVAMGTTGQSQSQMSPLMMSLDSPSMDMMMMDLEPLSKRPKNGSSDSEDPDERRRKFLERNRAAAARCRQKRKHWISNLERKAEELQQTNNRLQSEVSVLRGEVAQLKTLLLAHQDCPITLQQKSQGQLALHTISMVESSSSLPFEVTQLVTTDTAAAIALDNQVTAAVVPDNPTFSLAADHSAK